MPGGLRYCTVQTENGKEKVNIFEQPDWDITDWDVSNVTNMSMMFAGASYFNQNIGKWAVRNVEDMSYMFANTPTDDAHLGEEDLPYPQFLHDMKFNKDINDWDVSNVKNAEGMFYGGKQAMKWENMSRLAEKNPAFEKEELGNLVRSDQDNYPPPGSGGGKRRSRQRKIRKTRKTRKTRRNKRKSTRRNRRR